MIPSPPDATFDDTLSRLEELVVTDPAEAVRVASGAFERDTDASIGRQLRLRRMLAMACANTNQFERALTTCEAALALPGGERAPIEAARVRLAAMQPLAALGQVDEAIASGETALRALEMGGHAALAGRAALNIGAIHAMTGHPGRALPWFDRARDHLQDDPVLLGQVESNRGTALAALDRFREAETAFARVVELIDADDTAWAAAIAEENLADLVARQGDFNRSLRHLERSRRSLERNEAWGDLGRLNAEAATVLERMGLTAIARDAFEDAVALLESHGTASDHAMALLAYGLTLVDAGAHDAAASVLARATPLVEAAQHADFTRQLTLLRAQLALARRDPTAARASIAAGLAQTEELPVQQLRWQLMDASRMLLDGDSAAARSRLVAALDRASATQVAPLVAQIHQMLADLARDSGDDDLANAHARRAIAAWERIRATIQADRLRQSWHHGRLGLYEDLYLSLIATRDPGAQREAFGIAERIRGRTLLDAMHLSAAELDSAPAAGSAAPLAAELDEHRRWLNWMFSALADGRELTPAQLLELGRRERAAATLRDRLDTLRPPSAFTTPVDLEQIQAQLDDTSVILSYLVVGDRITVQVITADTVAGIADLASTTTIADLAAQLQFQVGRALVHASRPPSAAREARLQRDTDAVLAGLHAALIAPVATWLDERDRAIVVPSGVLHSVPFAALVSPEGYLVDRVEIVTAPGSSLLERLRARGGAAAPPERALVVGVPDAAAPGLGVEARLVAGRLDKASLLLGPVATKAAILDAMPEADIVHLALHGRFDDDHPTASGLRASDGWITLDELAGLHLARAPLVVLTGCETGRVRVGRGDDLEGLIAAMLAAGARGVITSLWKTHDTAATELTSALYDALEIGREPSAALRASQRALRQRYPHPALWAPFVALHTPSKEP